MAVGIPFGVRLHTDAVAPAALSTRETPAIGSVPDGILLDVIRHSELIVLAVPQDLLPATGSLSPTIQFGAKETWYNVKLTVDSLLKGRLGHAKSPDYGWLPRPSSLPRRSLSWNATRERLQH